MSGEVTVKFLVATRSTWISTGVAGSGPDPIVTARRLVFEDQGDGTYKALLGNGTDNYSTLEYLWMPQNATLDELAAAAADVDFGGHHGVNLADPTSPQHAATQAWVQAQIAANLQGLTQKTAVRWQTSGSETFTIVAGSVTQIAGTTLGTGSPAIGDRVLVLHAPAASGPGSGGGSPTGSDQPGNAIYTVTGNTTNLTLARATDMAGANKPQGAWTWVEDTNASYSVVDPKGTGAFTYGTGNIQWSQINGAGSIIAGTGIVKSGNTLSADFGTGAGKVTQGNDSRLSDARTPTAHAASHASAGSDALTLAITQVTGLAAALGAVLVAANDLSEIAVAGSGAQAAARTNLGLGTISTKAAPAGSAIQKADGSGGFTPAVTDTDFASPGYVANNAAVIYVRAVATTAATNIASDLENGDTVDGVVLATGDYVLTTGQVTGSNNRLWQVQASGAAVAAPFTVRAGQLVYATEGTVNHDTVWRLTTDGTITLGTTSLTWTQLQPNLPSLWPMVCTGSNVWSHVDLGNATTQILTLNRAYYSPIVVPRPVTLANFICELTTGGSAGAVLRGALLNGNPTTFLPSSLIADYGTKVATVGSEGNIGPWSPGVLLTPGQLYFIGIACQGAASTVRVRNGVNPLVIQSTATPGVNALSTHHYETGRSGAFGSSPTITGELQGPTVLVNFT